MPSCDETPTSNAQQLLAQLIEKLSANTRSENKIPGAINSQQNDFDEGGEMRRVIREELQQMSEEPRHCDCFSRQFRNRRNFSCFVCSRIEHKQCYCTANANSKGHYVSHSEGTGQPLLINESF